MSFGKHMCWRLWSPLVVLIWVVATIGFAATAGADTSTDRANDHVAAQNTPTTNTSTTSAPTSRSSGDHAKGSSTTSTAGSGHGTSGDVTDPQPISNADANSGGANGQCPGGPYCSTRDGSASGNGSGGGKATGEPCAGCVGKADNKNPAGQLPNASDGNAGYECDTNHGIAQTNPAHTGCVTPPQAECVPTPQVPCVPPPVCVPTPDVPCVTLPVVSPPVVSPPVVSPPLVSSPAGGPPSRVRTLPSTGAPRDSGWLAVAALASVLAGGAVLLGGRRRAVGAR